ncbi:MAG TPA: hypothetical protein ENK59_02560 [Thioploca sp.]|nr:hypothetical protein [Thioploca sp.]
MNLKINYGIIFILFLLPFSANAVNEADVIKINHCDMRNPTVGIYTKETAYNCGKLLVGAANVYPNSIQWIGNEAGSIYVNSELNDFGFTGSEKTYDGTDDYLWLFDTSTRFLLNNANPTTAINPAPSVGFFYAPNKVGYDEGSIEYTVAKLGKISKLFVGEGIADDDQNPVITLNVEIDNENSSAYKKTNCIDEKIINGCTDINISKQGEITFKVTPKISDTFDWQEAGLTSELHNNVFIRLIASEKNASCSSNNLHFIDKGMPTTRALTEDKNDYYDFLGIAGPDAMLPNCERHYSFLRSSNKSFTFNSKNIADDGYIEYIFFVEGHYIPFDKQKWAGVSHQTFRIRTNNEVITKQVNELPSLGNAIPIQIIDGVLNSKAPNQDVSFFGGLEINDKFAKLGTTTNQKQKSIAIKAQIKISPNAKHISKKADIFVVIGYQISPSEIIKYYVQSEDKFLFPYKEIDLTNIKVAQTGVKLTAKNNITIYTGNSNISTGLYTIFIGYRLLEGDGTIFFNGERPITFTIE